MAPVTNGRLLFNEVPSGYPEPGKTTVYDTSKKIDLENVELKPGAVLVKVLMLSIDPYMRGKMRDASIQSYSPAYVKGEPIYNAGVGVVLRSENPLFKVGDHVNGMMDFAEYYIKEDATVGYAGFIVLKNEEQLPWSVYLGAAGMPGRTAYHGWKEYADAKKGETAFITTGAGPVGSFAIQLAKKDGLKVIASAGSDEKVKFMKDLGADVAFNYKTTSTADILAKEGPIDVYWDNVGTETLDLAFAHSNLNARFIECGMISAYNTKDLYVFKNITHIIGKRLRIFGLMIYDLEPKYGKEFIEVVPKLLASGELKYSEDLTIGLDKGGHAIADVQTGRNKAKSVVVVAQD